MRPHKIPRWICLSATVVFSLLFLTANCAAGPSRRDAVFNIRTDNSIPVDVYLPDRPPSGASILLIHGFMHYKEGHRENARWFAARGWIVYVPDLNYTLLSPNTEERVSDVSALLAWIRSRPNTDPNRIVLVGHSAGGLTALLAASKEKVAGVVGWDQVVSAGRPGTQSRAIAPSDLAQIRCPALLIESPPQSCNNERDQGYDIFPLLASTMKKRITIPGSSHCDFPDDSFACGLVCGPANEENHRLILETTAAWLEMEILGQSAEKK